MMVSPTTDRRQGLVGNTPMKAPVQAAASTAITLSGEQTVDGVDLLAINAAGVPDRCLVYGQASSVDNGIYDVSTGAWTRSKDANGNYDLVTGSTVYVTGGTSNGGVFYSVTTANPITIGTSSLVWAVSVFAGNLAAQLASTLSASLGAAMVGYDPVRGYASGIGQFLNYTFSRTAAEVAGSITPTNYYYPPGHVYRYGTNTTPGTTNMTTALQASITQAKQTGGADAYWPADTYLVSKVTLDGSGYNVRTAGGRKTILQQTTGTNASTGQIIVVTGSHINVGDLAFVGNIATDTQEFHHCVYVFDDAGVATIKNVHFGDLYGTDIRGDVFYVGSVPARPVRGIRFGTVSGTNVFRNLVSVTGGEVTGDAIVHDGPVGYRDFDVEPNTGSEAGQVRVNFIQAGMIQCASQDTTLANVVDIGILDLAFGRIAATTPGYTSAPGVNAQAVICASARLFHVGFLKMRDYNYVPFTSTTTTIKSNIIIDVADISNCCVTETVYKSLFADQGSGGIGYLEIGNLIATLFSTTKMVFVGNGMSVRVRRGVVSGGILASTVDGGQYENLALDCNSASGNILEGCVGSVLSNCTFTNASSATLLRSCTGTTLDRVTGTFSVVEGAGCADNRANNCLINSIRKTNELLTGSFLSKAMADQNQTLSATESAATLIRTTGANTAQRNLVVPADVRSYMIDNTCTTNGVQVIGPSGTGIVIAVAKKAVVMFDGTNVIRITADV